MSTNDPVIDLVNENHETPEQPATNEVNTGEEKKPTSKVRSIVWQHFPYVDGAKTTKCKYCGPVMVCGTRRNGTSALKSHLVNVCKTSPLYKKSDLKKKSTLGFKPTIKGTGESGSLTTHSFSQERCRLALAKISFFSELVKMQATITRMCLSSDDQKKNMAISIREKYEKYWDNLDNMNFLLYVAVVLDPRFKLRYVSFCIDTIYGKGTNKSKEILGLVKGTLDDLFEHYKIRLEKTNVQNTQEGISSDKSSSCGDTTVDLELEFEKFVDEDQDTKSEVNIYLADGKEKRDETFDILGWWKANSVKFPVLSRLARHVLAMPISIVASESAFSTGGRVIDKYRSSLSTKTAEALICTQDWIRKSPVDLELCVTMPTKDIEEMNDKLKNLEIDAFSKGKKTSNDAQQEKD